MTLKVGRDLSIAGFNDRRHYMPGGYDTFPGRKPKHDTRLEPQKRRVKGEPPPEDPRFMIVAYGKDARILDTATNTFSEPMSRAEALEQIGNQIDL